MKAVLWKHRSPCRCDICWGAIVRYDPVLPSPNSKAAHEWCVRGTPPPPDRLRTETPLALAGNVENPTYVGSGMIYWRGKMYDPRLAQAVEPGCTAQDLLEIAPDGWNGQPFLHSRRD